MRWDGSGEIDEQNCFEIRLEKESFFLEKEKIYKIILRSFNQSDWLCEVGGVSSKC
jgi:hypothetical protein